MKILFCGDVMPGGVLPYQDVFLDNTLKVYLNSFDLRVGTLECAIGTNLQPAPEKLKENGGNNNICFARDEDFYRIKELGFDLMSLGNNHSFDLCEEGLINTIRLLQKSGIRFFGAGRNIAEASAPAIVQFGGIKICFIGCCIKGLKPSKLVVATENSYGVYQPAIEQLVEQIKTLSCECDKLIVMPHWGEEHVLLPPFLCVEYAQRMIDAGADAVFGSHSHRISTNFYYKGKPVFFGLGNFLYPDCCLEPPRQFYYPASSKEVNEMHRCINYPRSVRRNTLFVWSEDSRVGISAEAIVEKNAIKVRRTLVRNGKDNILRLLKRDSRLKNVFLNGLLLPLANLVSSPILYRLTKGVLWRLARLKLSYLGDFRKDV